MGQHYLVLLMVFLCPFSKDSEATESLQFARISYSPIQNVGEKVIKEIYRKADVSMTVLPLPAKRAAYETSKGKRDGEIMRIGAYHQDKSQLYRVPYPLGEVKTQVFVRQANEHIQMKALRSYSVAVVRGVKHSNTYISGFPFVVKVDDVAKAMKFLYQGKVDAAVVSQLNGEFEIKTKQLTGVVPLSTPVQVKSLYHYINRKHEDVIQKVENTISRMYQSGELRALWEQSVEEELKKPG